MDGKSDRIRIIAGILVRGRTITGIVNSPGQRQTRAPPSHRQLDGTRQTRRTRGGDGPIGGAQRRVLRLRTQRCSKERWCWGGVGSGATRERGVGWLGELD